MLTQDRQKDARQKNTNSRHIQDTNTFHSIQMLDELTQDVKKIRFNSTHSGT